MYDINVHGLSQGLLGQWCSCRMAAEFRIRGWHRDMPAHALRFGSLMHRMLEVLHGNKMDWAFAFDQVEQEHRKEAKRRGDDVQQVEDDLAMAHRLLIGYAGHWFKKDIDRDWVELENVFDVSWNNVLLRGRVDGVFKDKKGKHWLFETKTKKYIDDTSLNASLQFDWQSMFYAMAKEQELDVKIVGVLYNVIRKPSLKLNMKETRSEYYERIAADVAEKADTYFRRYEVIWTDAQRSAHKMEFESKLQEFSMWLRGELPTYRNQAECTGKWTCSYLPACASRSMEGFRQDKAFEYAELKEEES